MTFVPRPIRSTGVLSSLEHQRPGTRKATMEGTMRTKTAIVSFVLGLLSFTSMTAVAEVLEGDGAPQTWGCETPRPDRPPGHPGTGGVIEGTG